MSIRQRVPFQFSEDSNDENAILDEQEQEELIQKLKDESASRNVENIYALQAVIILSIFLQMVFIFQSTHESPLHPLFPSHKPSDYTPLPLRYLFAILNLFIHLNLTHDLLTAPASLRRSLSVPPNTSSSNPRRINISSLHHHSPSQTILSRILFTLPLPYYVLLPLSAIAPILSLVSGRGWVETLWWSGTALVVLFIQRAKTWILDEREDIRGLEGLRYDAKGA